MGVSIKSARKAGVYLANFVSARNVEWGELMRDTNPNQGYGYSKAAIDASDSAQWLYQFVAQQFATWSMPGQYAAPLSFSRALHSLQTAIAHRLAILQAHLDTSPGVTPITVSGVFNELQACSDAIEYAISRMDEGGRAVATPAFDKVLLLADRFPEVLARLASRRATRVPLTMTDEYDVQYLFEALLAVEFDDIRTEETGASFAGGSLRLDSLLEAEGIGIEYKMTRKGLDAVALRKQLNDDIMVHKENGKIRQMLFFVYDPSKMIDNPRGFEDSLSKPVEALKTIRTIIQQR